jgi:hypothetical protein
VVTNSTQNACEYNLSVAIAFVLTPTEHLGLSHAAERVPFAKVMSFARCPNPGTTACIRHHRRARLDFLSATTMSRHRRPKPAMTLLPLHDLCLCLDQHHLNHLHMVMMMLRLAGPGLSRGGALGIVPLVQLKLEARYES